MTLQKAQCDEQSTDDKSDKSEEEKEEEKKEEKGDKGKLMKKEDELEESVARWSTLATAIKYVGGYRIVALVFTIQIFQTTSH